MKRTLVEQFYSDDCTSLVEIEKYNFTIAYKFYNNKFDTTMVVRVITVTPVDEILLKELIAKGIIKIETVLIY